MKIVNWAKITRMYDCLLQVVDFYKLFHFLSYTNLKGGQGWSGWSRWSSTFYKLSKKFRKWLFGKIFGENFLFFLEKICMATIFTMPIKNLHSLCRKHHDLLDHPL